jgi:hypothetical protein
MPIRINLLAEAQALEDLRRRDPVKRVILAGIISVILVLFWSSLLLFNTMITKSDLNRLEGDLYSRTNDNHQILESKNKLVEHKHKLNELHRLTTNRFLNGNLLEALQKNTVDNVQLMRLKVIQTYVVSTQEEKPKAGSERSAARTTKASEKSVKITEKTVLTLEAKDTNPTGSDANTTFQDKLSNAPYFQNVLGITNNFRLAFLGTPQTDPEGKTFVLFTLEARFPEKTR